MNHVEIHRTIRGTYHVHTHPDHPLTIDGTAYHAFGYFHHWPMNALLRLGVYPANGLPSQPTTRRDVQAAAHTALWLALRRHLAHTANTPATATQEGTK